MTFNSQMAQSKSMQPTLSLRKCLHRLMMKAEITKSWKRSLIYKKYYTAIPVLEGKLRRYNGNERRKVTTRSWKLLVEWRDGQTSWIDLKDLKESNHIEVTEYAVANRIVEDPSFKRWVSRTVHKRKIVISKIKGKYWHTTHKFSIILPKDLKEALDINSIMGKNFWQKAVHEEMSKVKVPWKADEKFTLEQVRSQKD